MNILETEKISQSGVAVKRKTSIRPETGWRIGVAEIWQYRELLFILVWRDIAVRYKQSLVGLGWAVIQPVLTMAIFTLIFGRFIKLPSEGVPYPVFVFCALLPWNYFARSLTDASDSLIGSAQLVSKVYFPRLILPLSKVFGGLADFLVAFLVLIALMFYYNIQPGASIIFLPLFILISALTALSVGLWLTSLNVKYRDIKFIVPFIAQFWMYASPVAYSATIVPEEWRWLYALNPMTGVIEGFRWAILGKTMPDMSAILISSSVIFLILVSGLYYFKRMERSFADII